MQATEEKLLRIMFLVHCMDEKEVNELIELLKVQLEELDAMDETNIRPVQFTLDHEWIEEAA